MQSNENWDRPMWLHPISLLFEFASGIRQQILPAIFALFSAARYGSVGLWVAIVFFSLSMMYAVFRYATMRYQFRNGELVVDQGLIFRVHRTVPVQRIQNIDMVQNVLHRFFGVAEVHVETASGTEPEATLRVLSIADVERLRQQVFHLRAQQKFEGEVQSSEVPSMHPQVLGEAVEEEQVADEVLLEIPTKLLLQAGLLGDRGMVLVAVLAGMLFQVDWNGRFRVNTPDWREYLPLVMNGWMWLGFGISAFVIGFLLLKVFSAAWYLWRFYGYSLRLRGDDLRIHCGLFTKISATVPRQRIQYVSIHRSVLGRYFGIASIRIETAGGGGANENASSSVSRRWFVPAIREADLQNVIRKMRPGLEWQEEAWEWRPLSPLAKKRMRRMAVVVTMVVLAISLWFLQFWGILAGCLFGLVAWWFASKKASATRYARSDFGLAYRSGLLTKKTSVAFFDKLQSVVLHQSPFDRRWNMATLSIDTSSSGPAEHRMEIAYLDHQFASQEYETIASIASSTIQKIDH